VDCSLRWLRSSLFVGDTHHVYAKGFQSLRPREFVSLVLAGEWKNAAAGDKVLT
jgi:hypothetical protein